MKKRRKKKGMVIVNGASYGFHCLLMSDCHLHVLRGHHFFDPRHCVDDYRCHCWFVCGSHDCHAHSDCGFFEGYETLIVIDCGISSSRCGWRRNYKSDSDCGRVDLGGLEDFSNDFYPDNCCNHIPLEEADPVDPSDGLGSPWGQHHAPTALEAYFDCNDET
mmetsp:Transcript_50425/g.146611  ORF Transcript_50425/g.146611 Transcript_50425/m.146611 type:complete len:162 (-) Transcript_50425:742-1227(-)